MALARALARLSLVSSVLVAACSNSTPPAPVQSALSQIALMPIGGGNALTLPAQRHLVRIGTTLLLSIQQDGAGAGGLGMFRSDDDGATFQYLGAIQGDPSHRDETDMIVVGQDVAVIYSYEGPDLVGSTAHDVYFQWWRHRNNTWSPDPAVRVFDSTSNATGYYRGELAIDGQGRYWIQAFFLETDGSATGAISVSTNQGASWTAQPSLVNLPYRGGGRLTALGTRMVFIYDGHDDGTNLAHFRVRDDSAPVGTWGPEQSFGDMVYHGAACSAVADGLGGMHFVYKDKNMVLWYRYFNGTSFGAKQQVESVGDWELQPAITRIGNDAVIFYNRVITSNTNDQIRVRTLHAGSLSSPTVLDSSVSFKGYPASVEVLPTSVTNVHCIFGITPDANSGGHAEMYTIDWTPTSPPPPVDMATRPPDLTPPPPADLATRPADLATPPAGSVLFSDNFNRNIAPDNGLGANWSIGAGAWFTNGNGIADIDGSDLAGENVAQCRDCSVQASVITFGTAGGVYLRAPSATSGDRYDLVLLSNGHVQIRRVRSGATTVLGDVASGVTDFGSPTTLFLSAAGASPVALVGKVNGVQKLSVSDGSSAAIVAQGNAGMWTTNAGVWFDNFVLTAIGGGGAPPDMATPRDLSVPSPRDMAVPRDLSTPPPRDLAVPRDLATPRDLSVARDLSVPRDLATPPPPRDLATPRDLSTPPQTGTLFQDNFNRNIAPDNGLGSNWSIGAGAWFTNGNGIADIDGSDLAAANVVTCRDCSVQASVITFGTAGGVYLRAPTATSGDRYDFVLLSNGHVQIRRVRSGAVTVLGDVASGVTAFDSPTTLTLSATGAAPVTLVGKVNGTQKLSVSDANSAALVAAGYAGMWTTNAGVWFDNFLLTGTSSTSAAPDMAVGSGGGGGGGGGGGTFALQVTYTDTQRVLLAVDPAGTAYATRLDDGSGTHLYASTDARTWTLRGTHGAGEFDMMTALANGTLLADSFESGGHVIIRSTDHGATWSDVLPQGNYRALTPHSWAELDGTVYFLQYQTFSQGATPINLYASTNGGATWSVRFTFTAARHGHGLTADPATHTLWALFGDTDAQSGVWRSTDGGATWSKMLGNQDGDVVDAVPLAGGGLLFGQDISFEPTTPAVAKLTASGQYTILAPLIGPAYSTHALMLGGYVVGAAREFGGDIYPPGEVSAHVYGSPDGVTWTRLLDYPWLNSNDDVRSDIYWELPSTHELVVNLYNVANFGPGGKGFQLVKRQ